MNWKLVFILFFLAAFSKNHSAAYDNSSTTPQELTTSIWNTPVEDLTPHKRKRRFLGFPEKFWLDLQGTLNKPIINQQPRGMIITYEYTLRYLIPTTKEILKLRNDFLQPKSKPMAPPEPPAPAPPPPPPSQPVHIANIPHFSSDADFWHWHEQELAHDQHYWDDDDFVYADEIWHRSQEPPSLHAKFCCPKESYYKLHNSNVDALPWQQFRHYTGHNPRPLSRTKREAGNEDENEVPGVVFFDLVGIFAEMHGYNQKHCIMRTLCEAQHFLLPQGHLLLHDFVRILINYALPSVHSHKAFANSIWRTSLNECAQLYGPHCRVSFLQHFTTAVLGKFM